MTHTRTLAEYATNLKFEDIPKEVVEQSKLLVLHTLGASLAAYPTVLGKKAIDLAIELGGEKEESTIFGDGRKVASAQAGFANGTLADILDWEDCSWTGHPSAGAIPATLAIGERIKGSGKDCITAVVAGYEVSQRIAMAVQPSPDYFSRRGWGITAWQIYAAVVPAAKLLRLDVREMEQALGIAGTLTSVVDSKSREWISDMYHYKWGLACKNGIIAALIAKSGVNGYFGALEGDNGYWSCVSDQCDWSWLTNGLGKDYLIMETLFKHWPTNMWIQQHLDGLDALMKEEGVRASDIAEIIVCPDFRVRMHHRPEGYRGILDAEYSIPYCLAAMLLERDPGPNWYSEDRLKDPELLDLAGKVRAVGPIVGMYEAFMLFRAGKYPEVTVETIMKDGRRLGRTIYYPKGHPKNRLTGSDYKELFTRSASFALKRKNVEEVMEKILELEYVDQVAEITDLLHH